MTVSTAKPLAHRGRSTGPVPGYPRRSPESDPGGRAERTGRGSLVIDRQVLRKIAEQAASEVAAAGGRSGGFLGIGATTDLSARPHVDVELTGRTATVGVDVALQYPASIARSSELVRHQVVAAVRDLTGIEVTRVDITVVALHHSDRQLDPQFDPQFDRQTRGLS